MSLRRQQIAVFLGTVVVIFGLFAGGILLVARSLVDEATVQTSLLLARQVEIALADSLRQRPAGRAPKASPWDFLSSLFPGKSPARPTTPSRRTEVKGLMRAYIDRSSSIRAMWVLNHEGKVLYASRSREEGRVVTDRALQDTLQRGLTTVVPRRESGARIYDVLVPVRMPKGVQGAGGLRLWVDSADMKELLGGVGERLTLLLLLAGGVALGGAFLTTALYTRRLRLIRETLSQAEAGTYLRRPHYGERDEVGASLDLIDRLVTKQRRAAGSPVQRVAVATRALAHEVRTPLNALAIHLEVLRNLPSTSDAHAQKSLAALDSSIHQLDELVRNFSDFTGPLGLEHRSIDIAEVLSGSLEAMKAICASKEIVLSSDLAPGPWPGSGDGIRLRQAFDNLLRNAVEAQPRGGEIRVTAHRNGNWLTLRFMDRGPGIAAEHRAALFDFCASTKPGGHGIGLPLSQLIVEAHGGTLQLDEGEPGGGAVFRLSLPVMEKT